ncbi:MAG: DUF3592 domain-containing protein [Actinomycetota bacterium]
MFRTTTSTIIGTAPRTTTGTASGPTTTPTGSTFAERAAAPQQRRLGAAAIVGFVTALFMGLLTIGLGVVFTAVGTSAIAEVEPHADGVTTVGQVVGSTEATVLIDGIVHRHFAPVYVYEDVEGAMHRVTDYATAGSRPPAAGTTVELSYLPGDPDSVRRTDVDRDWLQWFVLGGRAAVFVGLVVVVGAIGVFGLRRVQRWRNSGDRLSRNAAIPSDWSSVAKRA